MINKYIFKGSRFLVIIFISISFFITLSFSAIQTTISNERTENNFLGSYFTKIRIIKSEQFKKENLNYFNEIPEDFIMLREYTFSGGFGVLFKGSYEPKPPLIEGRFINRDDIEKHKKVIVIGKALVDKCTREGNNLYFIHENQPYEVIGIMGSKNKESGLDSQYYFNFSSLVNDEINFTLDGTYFLDAGENTRMLYNRIEKKVKLIDPSAQMETEIENKKAVPLYRVIMDEKESFKIIIAVVIVLALNTINTTRNWLESRKTELAVRKMVGINNKSLILRVIVQYEIVITVSFFIGFILYSSIIATKLISFLDGQVYFISSIIGYMFCLIVGLITCIYPIFKIVQLQPKKLMR